MVCLLWVQLLYKFPDPTSGRLTAPLPFQDLLSRNSGIFATEVFSFLDPLTSHTPASLVCSPCQTYAKPPSFLPSAATPPAHPVWSFFASSAASVWLPRPTFCPLRCILRKADPAMFRK